jgi:hypothetical protein
MVAASDQRSVAARNLAERLRDLREREYGRHTQEQVARVIGAPDRLSIATISLWEKPGSDRLPPPQRLAAYARMFCSPRTFTAEGPRLLGDDELTEQERQRESELFTELLALREQAQPAEAGSALHGQPGSFWQFPAGVAVSIVCSDASEPPAYADPSHPNYSAYARYEYLDALIEVLSRIRADSPESAISVVPVGKLDQDSALCNMVVIGDEAVYQTDWFTRDICLPTSRSASGSEKAYVLEDSVAEEKPEFPSSWIDGSLREDVGMIARCPHPIIQGGTITVVSGLTSRGVHGAALCVTDSRTRNANEQYIREAFRNADTFCILMCVPVRNNAALPPNLRRDGARLYEWSAKTGAP